MDFSTLPKHHAVLVTSEMRTVIAEKLWKELETHSLAHRYFNQTVLDIETAREIISWAKTPYDKERVGLISFYTSGIPAQNALLKILEEPPELTRFILITSNKESLLPTVLSRLHHHETKSQQPDNLEDAFIFLKTRPSERMKLPFLLELLERKDEKDRKDREGVRNFLLLLASALKQNQFESRYVIKTLEMASYAGDSSASSKSLLEYLAFLLPVTK